MPEIQSNSLTPIIIGNATLYHGDAREVLPTLARADLCIVDPPYGLGESPRKIASRGRVHGGGILLTDYGDFDWDENTLDAPTLAAILAAADRVILWGGNYYPLPPASKWLVWDKDNSGDFADCELAWTNLPGAVRIFRHMWNGMLRASERGPRVHPTQKPVALMRWCLQQAGAVTNVVDPCMGSAPIGIACAELGLPYIGIERDEGYFRIASERIDNAQRQARMFP